MRSHCTPGRDVYQLIAKVAIGLRVGRLMISDAVAALRGAFQDRRPAHGGIREHGSSAPAAPES